VARSVPIIAAIILFLSVSPVFSAESDTLYFRTFKIQTMDGAKYTGKDGEYTIEGLRGKIRDGLNVFFPRDEIKRLYKGPDSATSYLPVLAVGVGSAAGVIYYFAMTGGENLSSHERATVFWRSLGIGVSAMALITILGKYTRNWKEISLDAAFLYDPCRSEKRLILTFDF
jgi:hypothetical protein